MHELGLRRAQSAEEAPVQRLVRTVVVAADDVGDAEVDVVDHAREVVRRRPVLADERDPVEAVAERRGRLEVTIAPLGLTGRTLVPRDAEPFEIAQQGLLAAGNVPSGVGVVDPEQHPVAEATVRDGAERVAHVERAGGRGRETHAHWHRRTLSSALVDASAERQLAVDLFNHCWTLLDLAQRTPEQEDELIHAAHASRHHWGRVGAPENLARGEWLCSRVYAVLGRGEPAVHHARRCLAICEEHGIGDWDLAFAYETLARAHAVAGDAGSAAAFKARARAAGDAIADEEDRGVFESDYSTL